MTRVFSILVALDHVIDKRAGLYFSSKFAMAVVSRTANNHFFLVFPAEFFTVFIKELQVLSRQAKF
jgi:hypothetical protein